MKTYRQMERMHRRLRIAERIVPKGRRAAWRDEWTAELSFLQRNDPAAVEACCDGVLRDALMLRWFSWQNCWREADWRSPEICLRCLLACFVAVFAASVGQPHIRQLLFSRWGLGAFACFLLLALFTLPSTVVTTRYGAHDAYQGEAAAMPQRFGRWKFLFAKVMLLVTTCYLLAVEVTQMFQRLLGRNADWLLIGCGLLLNVLAIGWALTDQRERCPTCMRLLRHPARMGPPSWSLLGSCATEEMCDRGHGLLHQPAWETSWFENARWLQLDRTWRDLFVRDAP